MNNLIAIDSHLHRNLAIDNKKIEQHGAHLNLVPLVVAEFTHAASQYPIVLTKNEETGQFGFAALTGFEMGENLFWQDQQWQGLYLPLQIQRQPFFIGASQESNNDAYQVCFDADSPALCQGDEPSENGQLLFTQDGAETEYFQHAKQCLSQLLQGEKANEQLLQQLTELQLIQPMSLEITFANEQNKRINGLYTIDKDKMSQLSQESVFKLFQTGMLESIYAMLTSLGQLYALIERKNRQLQD